MLKKRLVGVITVRNGWAVQSFAYRRYLPLGRPEVLAENLDRWEADEILVVCIDRTSVGLGPDLDLLRRLGGMGLSTPLTYAGGVRTARDVGDVIQHGAERVCIDSALRTSRAAIREMSRLAGAQALIAALPVSVHSDLLHWYDYQARQAEPVDLTLSSLFSEGHVSEALIIDWQHEGYRNAFDMNLVRQFPMRDVPLIAFGGISEAAQLAALFEQPNVVAAGVGNALNYAEHVVQSLKSQLRLFPVRPPVYADTF